MNRRKSILVLGVVFYSLFASALLAQSVVSVIPYELLSRKMIVNVRVNDKMERFILDTGAEKSVITDDYFEANGLEVVDSITLVDSNSRKNFYRQTKIGMISTPDNNIQFKDVHLSVIDGKAFECFNISGLLGSDLLANLICTIDPKEKTLTLTSAEKRSPESLRYAHPFKGENYMPIIEVMVNGEPLNVLFDSGAAPFLSLNQAAYSRLDSLSVIKKIDVRGGSANIGIGGMVVSHSIVKFGIKDFRIGLGKFSNLVQTTSNSRNVLLGMAILDYGRVVIDYPRKLFYYIPFSKDTVILPYRPRKFDVRVLDGKLAVATVWSEMKDILTRDDLITHINGKPTGTYDFCESLLYGIEDLRVKPPVLMTIMTKEGKEVEVEY